MSWQTSKLLCSESMLLAFTFHQNWKIWQHLSDSKAMLLNVLWERELLSWRGRPRVVCVETGGGTERQGDHLYLFHSVNQSWPSSESNFWDLVMLYVSILRWLYWASQVALAVKNLPSNAGNVRDTGSIPGLGRSPGGGHGNLLQYSCLDNPMDRGAWWATVPGVTESDTTEATSQARMDASGWPKKPFWVFL